MNIKIKSWLLITKNKGCSDLWGTKRKNQTKKIGLFIIIWYKKSVHNIRWNKNNRKWEQQNDRWTNARRGPEN